MMTATMMVAVGLLVSTLEAVPSVPLLDGRCAEYADLEAERRRLGESLTLWTFQDRSYVWLCYDLPPDSFGTLDLTLEAPALTSALNLHVSAQLGEWPADQPDQAPQSPDSDRWWRVQGWWANAVSMNGMDREADPPRPRFLPSEGRELQLSKDRFGRGTWRLRFEIRAIGTEQGGRTSLIFPGRDQPPLEISSD